MSTMYQTDFRLAENCKADTDILMINQCDREDYQEEIYNGHRIRMISTKERGLSRSRNMAIKNALGDICVFCDDDVTYKAGFSEVVLNAFKEKADADIIAFGICKNRQDFEKEEKSVYAFKRARRYKNYCSCSLAFRLQRIIQSGIEFNVDFGTGSGKITQGEESLWQRQALKKGLKIYHHSFCMLYTEPSNSTWFNGYNEKYFYNLGAYLSQVTPKIGAIIKYYYLFRLRFEKELNRKQKIKWLKAGIRGYGKNRFSYEEYIKKENDG